MRNLVYRFNIHQENAVAIRQTRGKHKWLVKVWAKGEDAASETEIKNRHPCLLSEMAELMRKELEEVMAQASPCVDGGFDIYLLR